MVKYVVIGGCGFLGSHIVKCILKYAPEVTEVVAFDINICPVMQMWSPKLKVVKGDIMDVMALTKAVDGADVVIHTAGIVDVWYRNTDDEIYRVNVSGTRNVLRCCINAGVRVLVNTSSMEVVGPNTTSGVFVRGGERTPYNTVHDHVYPLSKDRAEKLVKRYTGVAAAPGMPALKTCSLRPTGIYGEGCDLLEKFFHNAVNTGNVVYGGSPPDSEHGRVYVGNVAWMHLLAARVLLAGGESAHKVNGEAFFCYDDSPYMSYDAFNAELFEDRGFGYVYVPYWVMKPMAVYNDLKRKFLGCFGVKRSHILNSYTLALARTSFTVKTSKASRMFGYIPLYEWSEAKRRTKAWISTLK
ncbi:3-beta-hydroxy-delta-5-C27 steroid oxidoreductase-like protein [Lumpfish ranavirus]|uniref:3-beta-hydroxy-delta-5-C27 steroid oxidoreductase-like protein n=1 Tax=Lumpfish ranavirus TaxID=2501771 RepID=A0A3Q9T7L5_9VIRU|nr:3-beta-hydroxy-delta-5-C27 steroid oxidoreductase-like protein [Lumpfish ranavirus]AZY88454.1 3-beta-hydroxy-delta-5-C27 steroid oxidoreductase-like protein [Lumpfish ranavirus]AZY88650.1 3-beta-hydroxy-delta-5-C27 steroid oxidoreductase-like protein [Lumpfish ranavirus]